MEVVNDLYAWLEGLHPAAIYAVLFAIAYAENVFPPVPGDVALVVGGMLAGIGLIHLPLLVVLSTVAGGLGFMSVYAVGWKLGHTLLDPDKHAWVPKDVLRRAERSTSRHGRGIVLANRFLPGLRSVIGLAVGMSEVPAASAAVLSTVSAAVWSLLLCGLGYALGDNRARLFTALGHVKTASFVLLGVLVIVGLGYTLRGRWRRRTSAVGEAPSPQEVG